MFCFSRHKETLIRISLKNWYYLKTGAYYNCEWFVSSRTHIKQNSNGFNLSSVILIQ